MAKKVQVIMGARSAGHPAVTAAVNKAGYGRNYAEAGDRLKLPAAVAKQLIEGGFAKKVEKAPKRRAPDKPEKAETPQGSTGSSDDPRAGDYAEFLSSLTSKAALLAEAKRVGADVKEGWNMATMRKALAAAAEAATE